MAGLTLDNYEHPRFGYDDYEYKYEYKYKCEYTPEVPKEIQMENKSKWERYPDKKPEDGKLVLVAFYDEDQKVLISGIYDAASETVSYTREGALTRKVYLQPKSYSANLYALAFYTLIVWKYLGDMNQCSATGESFPDELFT